MELIQHAKPVRKPEVHISTNPLVVWLTPTLELVIHKGDYLKDVAREVEKVWPLDRAASRQMVAYWFALGEMIAWETGHDWTDHELRPKPKRKYLKKRRAT